MYDYDILGNRAEDFILIQRVLRTSIEEIAGMLISKLEITDNDGVPEYDNDIMQYILDAIHSSREKGDIMEAIFYDELKKKAEEDAKHGQLQGTNETGEETVQDI